MINSFKLPSIIKLFRAAVSGVLLCSVLLPAPASAINLRPAMRANTVSISNNSGGSIIQYALRAAKLRNSHGLVKFTGRCDSACTLFLGLPAKQICVSPGSYFRFHAPVAASSQSARFAQNYMMRKYPGWVRGWINRNHGLSRNLITMEYKYASRFIPTCSA